MGILLAARKSDLARLQAEQVGAALQEKNSNLTIDYHFRQSLGDINQDDPLWKMPEKGVFTEDFREGLLNGQFDMVVHSWKDLPIDQEEGTEIVATLPRADSRDLFLFKKSHLAKVSGDKKLKVFSSSPRRIYNLESFFKCHFPGGLDEVQFTSVRGNIHTRVRKLLEDESVDGLIVAKAAIDRLLNVQGESYVEGQKFLVSAMQQLLWQVLPLSVNPTAAAQGALAVEVRSDRDDLKKLLSEIHCQSTWENVKVERAILKSYGGGCHQKIGVSCLSRSFGTFHFLRGETDSGETLREIKMQDRSVDLDKPMAKPPVFFNREAIPVEVPADLDAHFVARYYSNTSQWLQNNEHKLLWASGVKTWQKLAADGLWVHGCSDSLGEKEPRGLASLIDSLKWVKWTHDQAPAVGEMPVVASYRLVAGEEPQVDLEKYNSFYWMSGSQFKQAVKNWPEIVEKQHYCGPGHTSEIISEVLKNHNLSKNLTILPSFQMWQQAVEESS